MEKVFTFDFNKFAAVLETVSGSEVELALYSYKKWLYAEQQLETIYEWKYTIGY